MLYGIKADKICTNRYQVKNTNTISCHQLNHHGVAWFAVFPVPPGLPDRSLSR